jgi:hypothetical protein
VDELFDYSLHDQGYMVRVSTHNEDNQQDKPIGLSVRKREQISRDVLWSAFEKMAQSNARNQVLYTFMFHGIRSANIDCSTIQDD